MDKITGSFKCISLQSGEHTQRWVLLNFIHAYVPPIQSWGNVHK